MLNFSCFVPPPLVLHCSKISLDFGLEGLELLALRDGGRVNVQRQYSPDQSVVSPALSASNGTGHTDVPDVSLADNDEVYQVPVFRPRVHPGGLVLVCHPEQGVDDAEAVLCTLAEEEQVVVIDFAYSVFVQNAFPAAVVPSHPCIKSPRMTSLSLGGVYLMTWSNRS